MSVGWGLRGAKVSCEELKPPNGRILQHGDFCVMKKLEESQEIHAAVNEGAYMLRQVE